MNKFRINSQQSKKLIVSMTMAVIVAMPMLSQPLGLSFAFSNPEINANKEQSTALIEQETTYSLEPLAVIDGEDLSLNRSMDVADVEAMLRNGEDIDGNEEDLSVVEGLPEEIVPPVEPVPAVEPADPITDVAAHTRYVNAGNVNLRTKPNTESAILSKMALGDKLTCTGEMAGWLKVKDSEGREGFITATFTSKTMVFRDVSETVYVNANAVNLRKAPATSSEILIKLNTNQKLIQTGIGDGWIRVKTTTGKTGYIVPDFLTNIAPVVAKVAVTKTVIAKPSTSSSSPVVNSSGNKIVDLARSMLGVRYVFGSASRSGVDCSGLIYYIYNQIGVSVPRSSSGYYNFGSSVSLSQIQLGDVIAMDTRKSDGKTSITHVGVYVGGGNMIHASSTNHKVVLANVNSYLGNGIKLITIRRIRT